MEQHLLPLTFALASACAPRAGSVSPAVPAALHVESGSPAASSPLVPASGSSDAGPATTAVDGSAAPNGDHTRGEAAPTPPASPPLASAPPTSPSPASAPDPASYGFPKDTLVLHIGDSFAGSLGIALGKRLKAAGVRSVLEFQTASYVPTWASGKELPEYLEKFRPGLVLITLGANEVELTNPEQRASTVRRLVGKLGGRPCVWITPPTWKRDTGIFRVIRENAAPCRVLDSDTIVHDLPRRHDKIHPTDEAREVWADAVVAWLARERKGAEGRPWELRAER